MRKKLALLLARNMFMSASVCTILVVCLGWSLGTLAVACTSQQKHAAKTAIDIATATCVVLRGTVDNGVEDQICATEEELAPIVKHLFDARKRAALKSGKVGATTAHHPDDLPPFKGDDACMAQ